MASYQGWEGSNREGKVFLNTENRKDVAQTAEHTAGVFRWKWTIFINTHAYIHTYRDMYRCVEI